jgi:hypothetical protein
MVFNCWFGFALIGSYPVRYFIHRITRRYEGRDEEIVAEPDNVLVTATTLQLVNGSREAMNAIMELGEIKLNEGDYIVLSNYLKIIFNDLQTNTKQSPILGIKRVLSRRILNRNSNLVFELTPDEQVEIMQARYKQHYRDSIDELIERIDSIKIEQETVKFEKQHKWAMIKILRAVKSDELEDVRLQHKELVQQGKTLQSTIDKLYDELDTTDKLLERCLQGNYYEFER